MCNCMRHHAMNDDRRNSAAVANVFFHAVFFFKRKNFKSMRKTQKQLFLKLQQRGRYQVPVNKREISDRSRLFAGETEHAT